MRNKRNDVGPTLRLSSMVSENYSMLMASSGQASTQTPQSTQASGSTTALSPDILIASLGHSPTHDSQPVHFSLSTTAGISKFLSKNGTKRRKTETAYYPIMRVLQLFFQQNTPKISLCSVGHDEPLRADHIPPITAAASAPVPPEKHPDTSNPPHRGN